MRWRPSSYKPRVNASDSWCRTSCTAPRSLMTSLPFHLPLQVTACVSPLDIQLGALH
jgi:hypothetical protein